MANVEVRAGSIPTASLRRSRKHYQAASIQGQTVAFQEAGANSYVKMTFTGNTITKGADLSASEFQLQITGGTFDQSDDWSWAASGTRARPTTRSPSTSTEPWCGVAGRRERASTTSPARPAGRGLKRSSAVPKAALTAG